jgi:predicted ATPase
MSIPRIMAERWNFHVITGGPGSGKTSIVEALAVNGYCTVAESGRAILRQQAVIGGTATHVADAVAFRDLMLQRGIDDYERMSGESGPVFFDRGVAELVGYCRLIGVPVAEHVRRAAAVYRYNPTVFVAPPWPEIYANDDLRKQGMAEAARTFACVVGAYRECGYRIVEVPQTAVADRAAFILERIGAAALAPA